MQAVKGGWTHSPPLTNVGVGCQHGRYSGEVLDERVVFDTAALRVARRHLVLANIASDGANARNIDGEHQLLRSIVQIDVVAIDHAQSTVPSAVVSLKSPPAARTLPSRAYGARARTWLTE